MKKSALFVVGMLAIAGLAPMAQAHVPAVVSATAVIAKHAELSATAMDFGTLSPKGSNGADVELNSTGLVANTDYIKLAGTPLAGQLTVTGETGAKVQITWNPTMTLADGSKTMQLNNIKLDSNNTGTEVYTVTSDPKTFCVGGTLHIDKHQDVGSYTGNITFIAEYI